MSDDDIIALERAIVDLADGFTNTNRLSRFIDGQIALTAKAHPWATQEHGEPVATAEIMLGNASRVLGVSLEEIATPDPVVERVIVAMTPFLRSLILFPMPRNHGVATELDVDLLRIPHVIMAIYIMSQLAKRAGTSDITFQAVAKLFLQHSPLISLLSRLDAVLAWRANEIDFALEKGNERFQLQYIKVARSLLPRVQRANQRTLTDILGEYNIYDGWERTTFLKLIAHRIGPRLSPLDSGQAFSTPKVKPLLQRFVLGLLPDNLVADSCRLVRQH